MVKENDFFSDAMVRESLGNPSGLEIEIVLDKFRTYQGEWFKMVGNKRRRTRDLADVRESELSIGHTVSKPYLVALLINSTSTMFFREDLYRNALKKHGQDSMVAPLAFDVHYGVREVLAPIIGAEMEIKGETEQSVSNYFTAIDNQFPGSLPLADQVQKYLSEKNKAKSHSQLLINDPTGFQLVDRVLQDLKEGLDHAENYPFCKEYVLFGGELARDSYKILYRVTE